MMLLVDSGNTRIKWRLVQGAQVRAEGAAMLDEKAPFAGLVQFGHDITRVAVSSVASEQNCRELEQGLSRVTRAPVTFYWSESSRQGLVNSYQDVRKMGADRWHGMVGAWSRYQGGLAVVDAGSAVTVDYVAESGAHIGGYILPGLRMMRRSLKLDAARIGFEHDDQVNTLPGRSTGECANHGLAWLTLGVIERINADAGVHNLRRVLLTGGDAQRFVDLGLQAEVRPGLVFEGLQAVAQDGKGE